MFSFFLSKLILVSHFNSPKTLLSIWDNLNLEIFLIQIILIYVLYRLISNKNYLKQILSLCLLLTISSVYLTLYQLELFSCFLFLAEFTIIIFFYSLFLHLQVSSKINTNHEGQINFFNLFFILTFFSIPMSMPTGTVSFPFVDYYEKAHYSIANDLGFFFYSIFRANYFIHIIVGLLLFFLTIYLFYTVNVYYALNLTRQNVFMKNSSKLSVYRGYYEQTAEEVQKILTNNKPKK